MAARKPLVLASGEPQQIQAADALQVDVTVRTITPETDAATIVFNLGVSDWHSVTLGGNRTLSVLNASVGQTFTLLLKQDATGTRTVTWFSGISWPGGTVPTLTTTAGKTDVLTFICTAANTYLGFAAGFNL